MLNEFLMEIKEPLFELIVAIIGCIFALLGVQVKKMLAKYLDTNTKQKVAKSVVLAVEQMYKNLHGEEKLNAAITDLIEILKDKNIAITEAEAHILIEAAVSEFNDAFKKNMKKIE